MNMPITAPQGLPIQTRRAPIAASAVDVEARTVTVTFSTGAAVRRRRWTGWDSSVPFDEVLLVSERAIDMTRLNLGAPVLDSHSAYSSRTQVGVVERGWIEGGEARALIRFPEAGTDADADRMFNLVRQGIIRNVSVGYSIDEARVIEAEKKGEVEKRVVERWSPHEISFVTVPADAKAQVRSADGESYPLIVHRAAPVTEETAMPVEDQTRSGDNPANTQTANPPAADPAAGIAAERTRAAQITDLATRHAMPAEFAPEQIRTGATVDAVRAAILDHVATTARATDAPNVRIIADETETRRVAMTEALTRGIAGSLIAGDWSGPAAAYRGLQLIDLAAEHLGVRRVPSDLAGREDIMRRAMHTTSDFPIIFENALNQALAARYVLAQPTYQRIARREDFNDFRPHTSVTAGDFPMLQPVGEGGKFAFGTFGEKKEVVAVGSYAIQLAITRQMLVNDRLGAIMNVLNSWGQSVSLFEETTFYAVFLANSGDGPTLLEGASAMFTTARTNKAGTAAAITADSVSLGRAAMRKFTSIDKKNLMMNAPSIILVGPDKETEAQKLVASIVPNQTSNVNIFTGSLDVLVSQQITGNAWWLAVDPSVRANFRWGYLSGYEAPRIRVENPFGQSGTGVSLEHDFGCGGIDWRAMYRNAGA